MKRKISLTYALCLVLVSVFGCGGNDCEPEARKICTAGQIHWVDACGKVTPAVIETCECACADDGVTCGIPDTQPGNKCVDGDIRWVDSCGRPSSTIIETCACGCADDGMTCVSPIDPLVSFDVGCTNKTACLSFEALTCIADQGGFWIDVGDVTNNCADALRCQELMLRNDEPGFMGCGETSAFNPGTLPWGHYGSWSTIEECQAKIPLMHFAWRCALASEASSCLVSISGGCSGMKPYCP